MLAVLCMVIGLLPGLALTAAAAENAATSVEVGGVTLSGTKPYYVNGKAQATAPDTFGENGYTAKFESGTLTLKGYNGGAIFAKGTNENEPINLTVVVDGANTINVTGNSGIYCMFGNLTVQGAAGGDPDALTITSAYACVQAYMGSLTVKDLASLELFCTGQRNSALSINYGDHPLEVSHVGTVKITSSADYSTVFNRKGNIVFSDIVDLAIIGEDNAICTMGTGKSASITNCGNVTLYSKTNAALYTYDGNIAVTANRLLAWGKTYGIQQRMGSNAINVTAGTIYIRGDEGAVAGKTDSVTVKTSVEATPIPVGGTSVSSAGGSTTAGEATIRITTTKTYDGQPFNPAPSAVIKDTETSLGGMTYLYSWYDSTGNTRLSAAPADAGTYKVTVYGYNNTYAGTLENQDITPTPPTSSPAAVWTPPPMCSAWEP